MARNRTSAKRTVARNRPHIFALSHQRKLPPDVARILHELVDTGEGRIEERAVLIPPIALGWDHYESQTAKMMRYIENFVFVNKVTPFELLPVHSFSPQQSGTPAD